MLTLTLITIAIIGIVIGSYFGVRKKINVQKFNKVDIGNVWAGHPVNFACERIKDNIFISYFNEKRELVLVIYNTLTNTKQKKILPEVLGWDSHNGISLGIDSKGFIHVSANMHKNQLVYYKSKLPFFVEDFETINEMTGKDEDSCTYPVFFKNNDKLFFRYRNGKSGKGDTFINTYDVESKSWSRVVDEPLFDGESERNAYPSEFFTGKDGFFHLVWVWREDPDCETNHTPSYIKTKDFKSWYTASGDKVNLPIKNGEGDIIEILSTKTGLLNGSVKVGFDCGNNLIVSYHRFDKDGNTQLYNARFINNQWEINQTSDWSYRWDFKGTGTINLEIEVFPVKCINGKLIQHWKHDKYGEGIWVLNDNFTIKEKLNLPNIYKEANKTTNDQRFSRICGSIDSDFFMKWETFSRNRDKERSIEDTNLSSSKLELYFKK